MNSDPLIFLHHILDSVDLIRDFIDGFEYDSFSSDQKTRSAVIHQLEIVGEASRHLEENFKDKYKEIPWKKIAGFRNTLAHEYWDIDDRIVWQAATKDVLELKSEIELIVNDLK